MKSLILTVVLSAALAVTPTFARAHELQQPAPAPQPPAAPQPFPEGARIGYIDLQRIANESVEGKAATAKVQELNQQKVAELTEKQKQLQGLQQKLQQTSTVLSDPARGQLEKDIDRLQREIQFFTQNAQAEVQELQQDLMEDFQIKLRPIISTVAEGRDLHVVFSVLDAGIIWAHTGLDLTSEIITAFDAAHPGR
jgi:outer membrane protein